MKLLVAITITLMFMQHSFAQNDLIVRKRSFSKHYFIGNNIKVKTKQNNIIRGRIESLYFDSLEIDSITLKFNEIKKVYISREHFNFGSNGVQLIIAGLGLPTIVIINSLINDDPQLLPTRYLIISPAIMFVGGTLIYLGTKRVRMRGPAKMYVI